MKYFLFLISLFITTNVFCQKYQKTIFDYEKMKLDTLSKCDDVMFQKLQSILETIENNNSSIAVKTSKELFSNNTTCPEIYEIHGYALFRSGEWLEGNEIIEKGILKFGKIPGLIKRHSIMSIEMAELGTGVKNIDGNSVYKSKFLEYDEEQFKNENLKSALNDLMYLEQKYQQEEDTYVIGKIHQLLKNYNESNKYFEKLLTHEKIKNNAKFNLADNFIYLNKPKEAETQIQSLLNEFPKEGELYEKLAEINILKGDSIASQKCKKTAIFYKNIPNFLNVDYSDENYDQLVFFGSNKASADTKLKKLEEIYQKKNDKATIELCILILKLHANHGNGVEEKASDVLIKIGKPSLDMIHKLFQADVSTCTITNLGNVMATIKDESSWDYLKTYLSNIVKMPSTLIPPIIPEIIIKFDEERGLKEVLKTIHTMLIEEENNTFCESFGTFVYYAPLKRINNKKMEKIAKNIGYTKQQIKKLKEKIK